MDAAFFPTAGIGDATVRGAPMSAHVCHTARARDVCVTSRGQERGQGFPVQGPAVSESQGQVAADDITDPRKDGDVDAEQV